MTTSEIVKIEKLPYQKVKQIAAKDLAYISENPDLSPFFKYPPRIDSFSQVIEDKKKEGINRKVLVEVLEEQYQKLDTKNVVGSNIQSLAWENTFTVTTAHQPSLFTGPLYYVLKIFSTINLANQLVEKYPDHKFVPVFVTGGEDHDFQEVNHLHLFGKTLQWTSDENGAVGSMHTKSLLSLLNELQEILGTSENGKEIFQLIAESHQNNEVYSEAVIQMLHLLFAEFGLVVLNMNHPKLKKEFTPIMREELFERPSIRLVNESIEKLNEKGFSTQANPRDINLFYLGDQLRERIEEENGRFRVLNTELEFSKTEIADLLERHPENFSPNVVLRPLYQEKILPNLAYIGGGGEIAYWLERKKQFEHFKINFPVLIRRNSVMILDDSTLGKIQKFGFSVAEIFEPIDILIRKFIDQNVTEELSLDSETNMVEQAFQQIAQKAEKLDPTLVKTILAEKIKQIKTIEQLEGRLVRAEKQKHEVKLNQLKSLKEKLFPGNGLQERHDNFLPFYLKYGREFFYVLKENLDPFDKHFLVIQLQ